MSRDNEKNKPLPMRIKRLRERLDKARTESEWRGVFHAILDLMADELGDVDA